MNNILKKTIITILIGSSLLSFMGCNNSKQVLNTDVATSNTEKEEKNKLDKTNPVIINYDNDTYSKIASLIAKNELKAKETYLNKTIKITGQVYKVKTENNKMIILLSSPNNVNGAYLEFDMSYKDKILDLNLYDGKNRKEGDVITVYGYGSKFSDISLVLSDCEFE